MLGTILFIDDSTETAILRAEDGKRYRFPVSEWPGSAPPLAIGTQVDFDADGDRAVGPLPLPSPTTPVVAPVVASAAAPVAPPAAPASMPPVATAAPRDAADPAPPLTPHGPDSAGDQPVRPLSNTNEQVPDYAGLSAVEGSSGDNGMRMWIIGGGAVLLLALAALAVMMWDNAPGSGDVAELSDATTLYAQEDLPVRNVASMTNSTVLGRIARGDRVSGVEVPGSSDPDSRWLRMDGGNRFVPMTGLGPSAPPAIADAPPPAPLPVPTPQPNDGTLDGTQGGGSSSGGFAPDILGDRPAPPPPPAPTPQPRPRPVPQPVPQPRPQPQPGPDPRDTPPVQ